MQKGDLAFMVTDISMDPHAGEVATGRLFSGTLTRGLEVEVTWCCKEEQDPAGRYIHGPGKARGGKHTCR